MLYSGHQMSHFTLDWVIHNDLIVSPHLSYVYIRDHSGNKSWISVMFL